MKRNVTISFITAATVFCVLVHYFLVFKDHHASKMVIAALLTGVIVSCILLGWLLNKYFKVTLHQGPETGHSQQHEKR
jgi:hypothetical protein